MAINPFFNANFYLANNADLVRAGLYTEEQLWNHYVQYGAQESVTQAEQLIGTDLRKPNAWFDVNYYLAAYPDLVEGGITAVTALDHFYNYGINEGRVFNPTISAADFNAETYAADNKDLREAFGIEEGAALTAEDKATLLKHYLAYGYAENREGAGDIAEDVEALNAVGVTTAGALGTIANDLFDVGVVLNPDAVIDGLGGEDTVYFSEDQTADAEEVTLRNIENVIIDAADVKFSTNKLVNVDVAEDASGDVEINFTGGVAGSSDELAVDVDAQLDSFVTNGVETLTLNFGKDVTELTALEVNKTQGSNFTVVLTGGDDAAAFELGSIENESSPTVKNFTLDGSALAGGFTVPTTFGELVNVANVTIVGSSAKANDFSSLVVGLDTSKTLTVVGGKGDDLFAASVAIDVFKGGAGEDAFTLAPGASLVRVAKDGTIAAQDEIVGFKDGDKVTGIAFTIKNQTGTLIETEDEFYDYLATGTNGDVFQYGDDAYVLVTSDADLNNVELVKLTGVNVEALEVSGTDLVFAS